MLSIRPAKNLQGDVDLPPSPDLFLLATVAALARHRAARIIPVPDAPIIDKWVTALSGCATITCAHNERLVSPATADAAPRRVRFPSIDLPYRDLVVFTLLGMGTTIEFESITEKRCGFWREQARRLGYALHVEPGSSSTRLSIADAPTAAPLDPAVDETDVQPLLGLLLGSSGNRSFTVENVLVSPLRALAPIFGYGIEVKNAIPRERDEMARRLHRLQRKIRPADPGQQFTVTADFTGGDTPSTEPLTVTLPGDELAAALFIAANCLFPKSSFIINNALLENWATPVVAFIRKMGCKVSLQQTGHSSFGPVGMLHLQTTNGLSGRKMDCMPAVQYFPFLPAMTVIAAFAEGETVFRALSDLRLDRPDGIEQIESCIRLLGARHGGMPDGIVLKGGRDFDGFDLNAPLPAPCAAAFAIAGLRCIGITKINDEHLRRRLPKFEETLNAVCEYRN
ncbi:MAG: hypothetical protein JXA18_07585 [Chitinispirillaceae bacterium]|nr:hypothetical protein [Chitinispirillaceae bacterium]